MGRRRKLLWGAARWMGLPALLLLIAAGCVTPPSNMRTEAPREDSAPLAAAESSVPEAEQKSWEEGLKAFSEGDYGKAASVFAALSESAKNEKIQRRALYALASTRLVLARTADEYNDALALWAKWNRQQTARPLEGEDPRMLTPLIERFTPLPPREASLPCDFSSCRQKKPPKAAPSPPAAPHPRGPSLVDYKELLQDRDKELDRMKSRIDTKEREIRRLKQQIESLEEIHLKFQEKKQEMSPP